MLYKFRDRRGFSLIEFLVSISIVTIILTVVISNQSTYTSGIALTNLADEVASSLSQAQSYGVGVREVIVGSSEFSAAYGLTFSLLGSGANDAYLYFADRDIPGEPGYKIYNGDWSCPTGGSSECLAKNIISRGNYIFDLCATRSSGGDQCNMGRIDITFTRPKTEAQFSFLNNGGNPVNPPNVTGAKIIFKSPNGATKSTTVYTTGQITVQ